MDSNTQLRNEDPAPYSVTPINAKAAKAASDDQIIAQAIAILGKRLKAGGEVFDSPTAVKQYCQLKLGGLEHEEFGVLFLDVQNRLLAFESMFRGTLTQTSVYPREVVKACIANNCAAVVLTHNHPSGSTQPSRADEYLTQTLKAALSLIDVRILDHVIVSSTDTLSMAERGLI